MTYAEQIAALEDLVERIVRESGDPRGFNAQQWLLDWISRPVPALGHRPPAEILNEPGGFEQVQTCLLRMQSGAYG
jgi:uncharacterized protein (DUF2384 family)